MHLCYPLQWKPKHHFTITRIVYLFYDIHFIFNLNKNFHKSTCHVIDHNIDKMQWPSSPPPTQGHCKFWDMSPTPTQWLHSPHVPPNQIQCEMSVKCNSCGYWNWCIRCWCKVSNYAFWIQIYKESPFYKNEGVEGVENWQCTFDLRYVTLKW